MLFRLPRRLKIPCGVLRLQVLEKDLKAMFPNCVSLLSGPNLWPTWSRLGKPLIEISSAQKTIRKDNFQHVFFTSTFFRRRGGRASGRLYHGPKDHAASEGAVAADLITDFPGPTTVVLFTASPQESLSFKVETVSRQWNLAVFWLVSSLDT